MLSDAAAVAAAADESQKVDAAAAVERSLAAADVLQVEIAAVPLD